MELTTVDVVVAGHICLDMIPRFNASEGTLKDMLTPGKLTEVGAATLSTGGAVSNTGLALHHLGLKTRLMGKVGDDILGSAIVELLMKQDERLASGMIVAEGESTSYSVVISPPNVDRIFLHSPGANNSFTAAEVPREQLDDARLFHFGYPPIMRQTYADGGTQMANLFQEIRQSGAATSLDMAQPDPASEAGKVDWTAWLERVLPEVDIFGPSFEEILFMLDRARYEHLREQHTEDVLLRHVKIELLDELAGQLLDYGVSIVMIKLGDQGLYLRTTDNIDRLSHAADIFSLVREQWQNRQLLSPCFRADVTGTTGAGDTTFAGFLAGLLHHQSAEAAMQSAVGTGAFSVEAADATSGVPDWKTLQQRIEQRWPQLPISLSVPDWTWNESHILRGPHDAQQG